MLSVLEMAGLAEVGLERVKTNAARWGMATGSTAKLHISMADFRNGTMFIVQVLKHVMAMLCEAKPALTCGRQGRAWGGGQLLSGLCGQVLYCTELCCTESVPRQEEGSTGKYQHEVEGVPECWYFPVLPNSSQGTDIIQFIKVMKFMP